MTKENRLVQALNRLYGFEYIKKSSVRKTKQYFDEKRNEHVFIIEYRVIKGSKEQLANEKRKKQEEQRKGRLNFGDLIRSINEGLLKSSGG